MNGVADNVSYEMMEIIFMSEMLMDGEECKGVEEMGWGIDTEIITNAFSLRILMLLLFSPGAHKANIIARGCDNWDTLTILGDVKWMSLWSFKLWLFALSSFQYWCVIRK